MKILPRYLIKEIIHYFLIFSAIFIVVLMVYEVFDSLEDFLETNPAMLDIGKYLVLRLPTRLAMVLPFICLLAGMFAYGLLAKNREILAMVAAGVSFRRLALPIFCFGAVMMVVSFWFTDRVAPAAEYQAKHIRKVTMGDAQENFFVRRNNLFVKGGGNRFYLIEEYLSDKQEMIYPTVLETSTSGNGIVQRIEADHARLVADAKGGNRTWEFTGARRWVFEPDGALRSYEKFPGLYRMQMEEDLGQFLSRSKAPEEMNFVELNEHIHLLKAKGGEDISRYQTQLQQKLAYPVACLLLAMLGYLVVVDVNARRFARGVTLGLALSIGFYVLNGFLKSMGDKGTASPLVAGWLPLVIYAGLIYILMTRLNRIRG